MADCSANVSCDNSNPLAVSMMTGRCFTFGVNRMRSTSSMPLIRGIWQSVMTKSGQRRSISCQASSPSLADRTSNPARENLISAARKSGAPLKLLKLKDGIRAAGNYQSIIKNAPHPNAAKLWVEWSTSEEGQQAFAKTGQAVVRKGVKAGEPESELTGIKLLPVVGGRQDAKAVRERSKRFEEIFLKKN